MATSRRSKSTADGEPTAPPEDDDTDAVTSPTEAPDPSPSSRPEPPRGGPDMQPAYPPGQEPS